MSPDLIARLRSKSTDCHEADGPLYIEAATALESLSRSAEEMREEAALWHDQRAKDTPDAFEMELHRESAKAIRALPLPGK